MRGLIPDKTKAEVFNRLRIFDVRSAIAGSTLVRISWNKIHLTFVTRVVFLSCLSLEFSTCDPRSLGGGTLVRISWNKIHLTFVAHGYITRVVFLSCLGTLQKRESWQTKRFSVGIGLTILLSPNSRRWLQRPYRKRPNKRLTSGGASSKAFAEKNASPSMWRL